MAQVSQSVIKVDGVDLFYRHAGNPVSPCFLLLHGFPSSSHQYRNLIPLLAHKYYVLAPDFPGFGFTEVPAGREYPYTFASLADTVEAFLDALKITEFAVYIFDYGAPTALRVALKRPKAVKAIISQNGNAYEEGIAGFWDPIRAYWKSGSVEDGEVIRKNILSFEATKWQYHNGNPRANLVAPETYYLDQALMDRPGNKTVQLRYFKDYETNLPLYPKFQEYFRNHDVPTLAIWGANDEIFVKAGATAFERDVKRLELILLDAPHFAIETREKEFADRILSFLERYKY